MQIGIRLSIFGLMILILIPLFYVALPVVAAIFAGPPLRWDALTYLILAAAVFVFLQLFENDFNFRGFFGVVYFLFITFLVLYLIYCPLTAWLLRKIL